MMYFTMTGTIADVDTTAAGDPILLVDVDDDDRIERIVVPASVWSAPLDVLAVGLRVLVAGACELAPRPGALPVALGVELLDTH